MSLIPEFEIYWRAAETTFNINRQALALLYYTANSDIQGITPPEVIETFPMRHGGAGKTGKTGIVMSFRKRDNVTEPWLLVFAGEASHDSRIVVMSRTVRSLEDPNIGPHYKDFAGAQSQFFDEGDLMGGYTAIVNSIYSFMLSQ